MLNLIVGIVSSVYSKAAEHSQSTLFEMRCDLTADLLGQLALKKDRDHASKRGKYMIVG